MKNESRRLKAGTGLMVLALALALVWLTGCVSPDVLQQDYGNAVRNNMAQSVINPQAGLVDTPATGLNPQAAYNELDQYNKSFAEKPAAPPKMTTTTY